MKLRSLFECIKCFMIGNYKETNSGIEDDLYPQDRPFDMCHRDAEISYTPLYTPPTEDIVKENRDVDSAYSQKDNESVSAKRYDEQDTKYSYDVYKSMASLIEELDIVKQKLSSEETIQIITFCQDKIIEGLSNSGAQLIDNDESYSNARHYPIPYGIHPEGIPIKRIIRPGVEIQKDIILKALVEL